MSGSRPRIACLVGPTASGKSALALELAERLGAEIVSADSRQVYRRLEIGTAKPTAAERRRVRHHCLDLIEPDAVFDAARFRAAATRALADIAARGRVALVVGGTGLYLRALLGGLCPAPPRVPAVRAALGRMLAVRGTRALHRALTTLDPATAGRVDPRDAVRIVRALEVGLTSGRRLSEWQAEHRFADRAYHALVIGLARPVPELDRRIAARAGEMFAAGFVDEVRTLTARGLGADAPALRAVGYPQVIACLAGRLDAAQARDAVVLATRRFAKRQRTWFRHEPGIRWRHPEDDRERIETEVREFLDGPAPRAARPA
jgi:tRNA dimethylallyltransferase